MSNGTHRYQAIIDEIKAKEIRITGSENRHKLLYKLCLAKEIRINGSPTKAAKHGRCSRAAIMSQATAILNDYQQTGLLFLPSHFKMRGEAVKYRHDGNANQNRNLNAETNRAQHDPLSAKQKRSKQVKPRNPSVATEQHLHISLFDEPIKPMSKKYGK